MPNETPKSKVTVIPAAVRSFKRVAVYCRVSTTHDSQDESLDNHIKPLKEFIAYNPKWKLYEVYTNKDSGGKVE